VQIGRSADSFDRVPVLDEWLEFGNLQRWILLLQVDNTERECVGVGYRIFDDDCEAEYVILLLVIGENRKP
jgi:hypothetical protein